MEKNNNKNIKNDNEKVSEKKEAKNVDEIHNKYHNKKLVENSFIAYFWAIFGGTFTFGVLFFLSGFVAKKQAAERGLHIVGMMLIVLSLIGLFSYLQSNKNKERKN